MKLSSSLLCVLPALVAGADRDLQIPTTLTELCSNVIDIGLGRLVPGLAGTPDSFLTCTCAPSIFPSIAIEFGCETTEPVCLPQDIVCGIPSVTAGIDVSKLQAGENPVSFDVCISEIIILEVIPVIELLGPLCLSLIQDFVGGGEEEKAPAGPGGGAPKADAAAATSWQCSATYDGELCTSCTVCDGQSGMMFDCSNVNSNVVSSTCSMNLPTTVDDAFNPQDIGMPLFDVVME